MAGGSDVVIINENKRTCRIVDFALPRDYGAKIKENEKRQVFRHCQRTKRVLEHESDGDTNYMETVTEDLVRRLVEQEIGG